MKISALFSFWMGIAFALFALLMAYFNLFPGEARVAGDDADAARGYALFWLFLSAFAGVMVVVSWLMLKGRLGGDAD